MNIQSFCEKKLRVAVQRQLKAKGRKKKAEVKTVLCSLSHSDDDRRGREKLREKWRNKIFIHPSSFRLHP